MAVMEQMCVCIQIRYTLFFIIIISSDLIQRKIFIYTNIYFRAYQEVQDCLVTLDQEVFQASLARKVLKEKLHLLVQEQKDKKVNPV